MISVGLKICLAQFYRHLHQASVYADDFSCHQVWRGSSLQNLYNDKISHCRTRYQHLLTALLWDFNLSVFYAYCQVVQVKLHVVGDFCQALYIIDRMLHKDERVFFFFFFFFLFCFKTNFKWKYFNRSHDFNVLLYLKYTIS